MENYTESIWTGPQQRSCADAPMTEHVVGVDDHLIVEVDVRQRVQTIKHQIDMVVAKRGGVSLKHSLVLPVGQTDPLQAELVIPIEWVGDKAVTQQVGLHHARNLRRMPLLDIGFVGVPEGA